MSLQLIPSPRVQPSAVAANTDSILAPPAQRRGDRRLTLAGASAAYANPFLMLCPTSQIRVAYVGDPARDLGKEWPLDRSEVGARWRAARQRRCHATGPLEASRSATRVCAVCMPVQESSDLSSLRSFATRSRHPALPLACLSSDSRLLFSLSVLLAQDHATFPVPSDRCVTFIEGIRSFLPSEIPSQGCRNPKANSAHALHRHMRTPRSPSRQGRPHVSSPVNSYSSLAPSPPPIMPTPLAPLESGSSSLVSTPPELPAEVDRKVEAAQRALSTVEDAIAAIRERAGLTTVAHGGKSLEAAADDPLLYLPPLLSRLPSDTAYRSTTAPRSDLGESSIDYTISHLPRIDVASLALHRALHVFRPVTPLYAIAPYPSSFNWEDIVLEDDLVGSVRAQAREWYIVAFRSKRRKGFTPEEAFDLYGADREAHEEAVQVSPMPRPLYTLFCRVRGR